MIKYIILSIIGCTYITSSVSIQQERFFNLESTNFEIGQIYIIDPPIKFKFAKFEIDSTSYSDLNKITIFLKANYSLSIEIGVHTDSRVNPYSSSSLCQRRAMEIADYLISKGIEPNRLKATGYGDSNLLISEKEIEEMESDSEKEAAHYRNRRVELKIVAIDEKN